MIPSNCYVWKTGGLLVFAITSKSPPPKILPSDDRTCIRQLDLLEHRMYLVSYQTCYVSATSIDDDTDTCLSSCMDAANSFGKRNCSTLRRGGLWHQVATPIAGTAFTVWDRKADTNHVISAELEGVQQLNPCPSVRFS